MGITSKIWFMMDLLIFKEAIFFEKNDKYIFDRIKWALDNKERLAEIAYNGYKKTLQFHTSEKRAEYILKSIGLSGLGI